MTRYSCSVLVAVFRLSMSWVVLGQTAPAGLMQHYLMANYSAIESLEA